MSGPMAEWSAGGQTLAHAQRSAAAVFAIRVAGAACAYGTQVLLARLMGKEGYGVFATTWVWILVLGHIAVFGLAQSVCSFVPAYRARNEIELARGFLAWGAAGTLGVATAMAALGALALWFAQGSINEAYRCPVLDRPCRAPRLRAARLCRGRGTELQLGGARHRSAFHHPPRPDRAVDGRGRRARGARGTVARRCLHAFRHLRRHGDPDHDPRQRLRQEL